MARGSTTDGGRTPLMAGNWKLNLDHQQATHLVQKLVWTLEDAKHEPGEVDVLVVPAFTAIRSVQTLVEGDGLPLLAQALDAEFHHIAGLQEHRRLHAQPDAGRRAGRNDVAGMQRHELVEVGHEEGDAVDHRLG